MRRSWTASSGLLTAAAAAALAAAPVLGAACAKAIEIDSGAGEGGAGGDDTSTSNGPAATTGSPSSASSSAASGSGAGGQGGSGSAGSGGSGGQGACVPGETQACYSGPPGSENLGPCKGGKASCMPDASGFGPCVGEVVPKAEDCATIADDDCDGEVNEASAGCGSDTCSGCDASPVGGCASDVVVVGHYEGGSRTVCVGQGDGSTFKLALMSYDTTFWTLTGAIGRVAQIQVYSVEPLGSIMGNGNIPTMVQEGGFMPADPYDYANSMGDCPAHTGYAGAVFGAAQAEVCHMEQGLPDACSYPSYTCLSINP